MEAASRVITKQFIKLRSIDYSAMVASDISNVATLSDVLEIAHVMVEDELKEGIQDADSFTEEIQEALQEQVEAPLKFQERVAKWSENKKAQYRIAFQFLLFLWCNFVQPYFQDNIGKPVTAYVVSNVKELPEKGAKIIGQLHDNIEAIIIENTNYYYKVTFTDDEGETKEGYVAKRNFKIVEEETEKQNEEKSNNNS
ncbi:MAG: hypothetical protein ACI4CT_08770 [Lachnospiraceae bacterium]